MATNRRRIAHCCEWHDIKSAPDCGYPLVGDDARARPLPFALPRQVPKLCAVIRGAGENCMRGGGVSVAPFASLNMPAIAAMT